MDPWLDTLTDAIPYGQALDGIFVRHMWMRHALCADADPDVFFAEQGHPAGPARALCDRCPVRRDCLELALDLEGDDGPTDRFGVWGGLTGRERARLAAERAMSAA